MKTESPWLDRVWLATREAEVNQFKARGTIWCSITTRIENGWPIIQIGLWQEHSGVFQQECRVPDFLQAGERRRLFSFISQEVPEFSGIWHVDFELNKCDEVDDGSESKKEKWFWININREELNGSTKEFEDLVYVECEFSLISATLIKRSFKKEYKKRHGSVGFPFVKMDRLRDSKHQLISDTLVIMVKVKLIKEVAEGTDITLPARSVDHNDLANDLNKLPQTAADSDLVIEASDNAEIPVHLTVLRMRRTRTGSLFSGPFFNPPDGAKQRLHVDIDGPTLTAIIQYVYSGSIACPWPVLEKITVASHKYDMSSLHQKCIGRIEQSLSDQNAAALLHFASRYNLTSLHQCICRFLKIRSTCS